MITFTERGQHRILSISRTMSPRGVVACDRLHVWTHPRGVRLLFNLADKKTSNYFVALSEAFDVESEVYCQRRSGNIWRMRASAARPPLSASRGCAPPCLSTVLRSWVGFPVALP